MEQQIGHITHYYNHLHVAVLELSTEVKVGDVLHILGHTTDFTQPVKSLEIEHHPVRVVGPGMEAALKVVDKVRRGDTVYKVIEEQSIQPAPMVA